MNVILIGLAAFVLQWFLLHYFSNNGISSSAKVDRRVTLKTCLWAGVVACILVLVLG